uniref:Uncharacterized protein n=1 Tax=Timema monikensis TaxID=170555 RepID=A0A7R9DZ13_9NEOP|nr:unnamed protein product [Timema monikensis]
MLTHDNNNAMTPMFSQQAQNRESRNELETRTSKPATTMHSLRTGDSACENKNHHMLLSMPTPLVDPSDVTGDNLCRLPLTPVPIVGVCDLDLGRSTTSHYEGVLHNCTSKSHTSMPACDNVAMTSTSPEPRVPQQTPGQNLEVSCDHAQLSAQGQNKQAALCTNKRVEETLHNRTYVHMDFSNYNFNVLNLESKENYYRNYSIQGVSHPRSYLHQISKGGDKYSFIGVDACLEPGPRRPFNFVGMLRKNNVLISLLGFTKHVKCQAYVRIGKQGKDRIVSLQNVVGKYNPKLSYGCNTDYIMKALIGFYSFTGCDSVSAFYGKGKGMPVKRMSTATLNRSKPLE